MPAMSNLALDIVVMEEHNYYNYFTEVEEAFVSRRGAPMLISPLDWALVESWKKMGIPLHIVLRGINKSFEGYSSVTSKGKRVNTLFYCQQEVISNFKDYVESQVGGNGNNGNNGNNGSNGNGSNGGNGSRNNGNKTGQSPIFPKQELIDYINSCRAELQQPRTRAYGLGFSHLQESLGRAMERLSNISSELASANSINTEGLERDLTLLEEMIYENLRCDLSPSELEVVQTEAEQQLRPHKRRMDADVYKQTFNNYVAKRLRELHLIPRLSLFYML